MNRYLIFLLLPVVKGEIFSLKLPKEVFDYRDLEKESSFCTYVDIEKPIYIYRFDPVLNDETNHITVTAVSPIIDKYEDKSKAKNEFVECTNLVINASDSGQTASLVKGQRADTIFVTSRYGSAMSLPPDVSFEVGKERTRLFLQVHFKPMKNEKREEIGVDIHYTAKETSLKAGIYSLHAGGTKVLVVNLQQ